MYVAQKFSRPIGLHLKRSILIPIGIKPTNFHSCPRYLFQNQIRLHNVWNIFNSCKFGSYCVITKLRNVTPSLSVPNHIEKPSYFYSGEPMEAPRTADIKTEWQITKMRMACQIARIVLNEVANNIKVGVTTEFVDALVHRTAIKLDSYPSPLNYRGYPKSCCTSVNNIACHGIPDDRSLEDGDIVSVDITVFHNGYHGDCCETFLIGSVDDFGRHLVEMARKCRDQAISICAPGVPFFAIGEEVEKTASEGHLTVVPAFIGHGIGKYFHGPPDIYHCYNNNGEKMKPGMTFTVEPVIAQGDPDVLILEDGWTAVMVDNGRAAQFEHTVLITKDGHEILTA